MHSDSGCPENSFPMRESNWRSKAFDANCNCHECNWYGKTGDLLVINESDRAWCPRCKAEIPGAWIARGTVQPRRLKIVESRPDELDRKKLDMCPKCGRPLNLIDFLSAWLESSFTAGADILKLTIAEIEEVTEQYREKIGRD